MTRLKSGREFVSECSSRIIWTPADIDNAAPRFSADGRVALLRVDSGFQSEPDAITRCPNLLADMDLYSSSCYCDPMGRNTTQCKDDAHDHGSYFVSVCSRPIWRCVHPVDLSAQIQDSTPIRRRSRSRVEYLRVYDTCRTTSDVSRGSAKCTEPAC